MKLEANKNLSYETCEEYFEGLDLSFAIKMQMLNRVEQAYINAEDKLSKYMSDGQPAINFLKEVRVFDPRHTAFMSDSVSSYESIPGFSEVPKDELDAYFICLGPAAVSVPRLSGLAIRYKSVIVNSANAEHSNSIYKLVLSSRRRSVTKDNLKALSFSIITRGLPVEHLRTKTLRRSLMSSLMRPRCFTSSSLYVVLCCVDTMNVLTPFEFGVSVYIGLSFL